MTGEIVSVFCAPFLEHEANGVTQRQMLYNLNLSSANVALMQLGFTRMFAAEEADGGGQPGGCM